MTMGSKHIPCNHMNLSLTRLKLLIADRNNKKITLAFIVSVILATLTFNASSSPLKHATSIRKGVGTIDATGELHSVLRRKQDGRAAVAIIRVIDDETDPDAPVVKYLVQMKSHDYPIPAFRGSICLLGGNANVNDATPVDTLVRELREELGYTGSLDWINKITPDKIIDNSDQDLLQVNHNTNNTNSAGRIRYLGLSMHSHTAEIIQKPHPYSFLCALYEITLYPFQLPPTMLRPRGATVKEGRLALLTEDQLIRHAKYAWGYEYTMGSYFGKNVTNVCEGVGVENIKSGHVGDWRPEKR